MKRHGRPSSPAPALAGFPPPTHALLLRACLAEDAGAVEAWQAWRRVQDLDRIDPAAQRLIPLLQHNLARRGVPADGPDLGRYRGMHRKTWYENTAASAHAARVIAGFAAAGIPTLVLKGTALAVGHYPAGGLRPVGDADLLVPAEHAPAALRLLRDRGGRAHPPRAEADLLAFDLPKRHGWELRSPEGRGVDLHWRLLAVSADAGRDAAFWADARPVRIHDVDTLTLSDPHHLLHVCVHGLCLGREPAYHWVADAVMILRHAGPAGPDWEAFLRAVHTHGVGLFAAAALRHLAEAYAAPIPPAVLAAVESAPAEAWQHAEFAAFTSFDPVRRRRYYCGYRLGRLRAGSAAWAALPRPVAYLEMLRLQWEVASLSALPLAAARKLARRLRRR